MKLRAAGAIVFGSALLAAGLAHPTASAQTKPLTIVVMDPLCIRLACPCVQGYAQRNYEVLGKYISKRIRRPVNVVYGDDLAKALRSGDGATPDLIIGKNSVVRSDAKECRVSVRELAMLTGKDGSTTITGWFVVRKNDSAQTLRDIRGRKIFFGPKDNEEKYGAALIALRHAGIPVPKEIETRPGCSDAALAMLQSKLKPAPAALISSYAAALIEGCGVVPKGALRVVGKTMPVPFVTVFGTSALNQRQAAQLLEALGAVAKDPKLCKVMETKGFIPVPLKRVSAIQGSWPGWRGARRDGIVPFLPPKLPAKLKVLWRQPLTGLGLAGVSVDGGFVVVPDRDAEDANDIIRCFRATDGKPIWKLVYPTVGRLDYGNSPRATPQISGDKVFVQGAFGQLHCLELKTGRIVWRRNLQEDFGAKVPTWGYCGSPLLLGDELIVNPGASGASVVALDTSNGNLRWKCPGPTSAYSSFISGTFGGKFQIVGYDSQSLGGWDPATGKRLWTLVPVNPGDFNVPTPVAIGGHVLLATETNGTRLFGFADDGTILTKPEAEYPDLSPDTSTPVAIGGRVFGVRNQIYCLDTVRSLSPIWTGSDPAFRGHVSLVASPDRILIGTYRGELLLLDAEASTFRLISRSRVSPSAAPYYAHPALLGSLLFLRDAHSISCLSLVD